MSLTVRYTFSQPLPPDLSTQLFASTQVPHVRCLLSGRYVVVTLATRADLEEHCSKVNTEKLKHLGLSLVESAESRCSRTVLAFRPPRLITDHNINELRDEIAEKNEVDVELVSLLPTKTPILKVILGSPTHAGALATRGIRAFSMIIPSHQVEIEKHRPVTQCLRCYGFDHNTSACPSPTVHCSKCASTTHTHRNCTSEVVKCLNCGAAHVAVSFSCPHKRAAQKAQSAPRPGAPTPLMAPTAASASHTTHTPSYAAATANTSVPAQNTPPPQIDTQATAIMTTKAHTCVAVASKLAGDDLKKFSVILPLLLHHNDLPTITIPPAILKIASQNTTQPLPPTSPIQLPTHTPQPTQVTPSAPAISIPPFTSTPKNTAIPSTSTQAANSPLPLHSENDTDNTSSSLEVETRGGEEAGPPSQPPSPSADSGASNPESESQDSTRESGSPTGSPSSSPLHVSSPSPPSPQHTPVSHKTRSHANP